MSEQAYLDLMRKIAATGELRGDRTGVGTRSLFGEKLVFDLQHRFPILTTKRVNFKAVVVELLWFLRGDTNLKYLHAHGVHIWDEWADANGDLGPIYGRQWRHWPNTADPGVGPYDRVQVGEIDQVAVLLRDLQQNPWSRRHILSAWNVADLPAMRMQPCHVLTQYYVSELSPQQRMGLAKAKSEDYAGAVEALSNSNIKDVMHDLDAIGFPRRGLSCQLYQRSADYVLGVPFNIANYALLTHLLARQTGMLPLTLHHVFGDVHLYNNHDAAVAEQLERTPRPLPTLRIKNFQDTLEDYEPTDFELVGYDPAPAIRAPIAV